MGRGKLTDNDLGKLHHTLWLNGTIPLLYIDQQNCVDILSCMSEPVSNKASNWEYRPLEQIFVMAKNIDEQIKRFSADRLSDGTFWNNETNKKGNRSWVYCRKLKKMVKTNHGRGKLTRTRQKTGGNHKIT
jgi:hypothetical protein